MGHSMVRMVTKHLIDYHRSASHQFHHQTYGLGRSELTASRERVDSEACCTPLSPPIFWV